MTTLVVLVEHAGGNVRRASLEALGAAHATGADCVAVLTGDDAAQAAQTLGKGGASKAVVLTGPSEHSADAVASAMALESLGSLARASAIQRSKRPSGSLCGRALVAGIGSLSLMPRLLAPRPPPGN